MRLKGKTALIAGASRNIGKAIALAFAKEGAELVLVARTHADELKQVGHECEKLGTKALPVVGDLAVTSAEPSILALGLPTVAASGLPGYESISIYGVFAPARTPEPIIRQLNRTIVAVLNMPEVRDRFFNAGVETMGSTPEQFAATIREDLARISKVIKDAGIQEQ